MSSNRKTEYILLSDLIRKLEDNSYYRTFAKSLLRTANQVETLPPDNELIKEMFHYFIKENELKIYYNGSIVTPSFIESEANRRVSEKTNPIEDLQFEKKSEQKLIWEKEIYIKLQDLKKLYANKCIVFPKSLLSDHDTPKSTSG